MKKDKWIWMGHAGHLCVSSMCRFHLNTYVGGVIVSTVGEYFPYNEETMVTIGSGDKSFYETMVFKAIKTTHKCCPFGQFSGEDLECIRYETAEEAHKGHLKLCRKWSKK